MPLVTPYNPSWPDDYIRVRDYFLSGVKTYEYIEHFDSRHGDQAGYCYYDGRAVWKDALND